MYPNSTIKIIDIDLDKFYDEKVIKQIEQRIISELKGEEISILFNNAEVFIKGRFDSITFKNVSTMINVNIYGLTILTKIFIEFMKKRNKKSLIVGSGSNGAQFRAINRIVYCSTKSYVEAFYEGLARDFPDKFDFTLIEIGPVNTDMNDSSYPFTCSPDEFASKSIKLIGKYNFIQGYWKHAILKGIISLPLVKDIARFCDERISAN